VLRHCLDEDVCGKPLATLLQPDAEDYFVLKPKQRFPLCLQAQ
jgi:hypothetical protein